MPHPVTLGADSPAIHRFSVLGVSVSAVQISGAIAIIAGAIDQRAACRYIAVTGMHGVMEAQRDPAFREVLNAADLNVPDGTPLVWLGRLRGHLLRRRVYGPELMLTFLQQTGAKYRHFFYGGAEGVPERLAERLRERVMGLQVAGTYSPPFRELTAEEVVGIVQRIRAAAPDIVWVGLSTPKQERWMHCFRDRLGVPVLIGVGAAFDIHAGIVPQAPAWMRENGLEWFYRLLSEPKRLWRRYLILGPQFVALVLLELLGLRRVR
jgi:N-acetylglucosaminyldiphosphoundecaprenol N-acetyl-beta-D-mannosaminyltransferase